MGTNASTGAVASAIQLIHAADPTAKIWLNTNHIETNSDASSWSFFLAQASALKAANAALTGVSFESHLVASAGAAVYTQLTSRAVVAARPAAGLDASIGELDVTDDTQLAAGPAGQVARDAIAAAIVSAYLTNFLAGGTPDHIICWQLTDGSSWLNSPPRALAGTTSSLFERQQHPDGRGQLHGGGADVLCAYAVAYGRGHDRLGQPDHGLRVPSRGHDDHGRPDGDVYAGTHGRHPGRDPQSRLRTARRPRARRR